MNESELKQLIKEEIKHILEGEIQLSTKKNERMFDNLKKKAEELYNYYHPNKLKKTIFGDYYPNKKYFLKDGERDRYFSWFVEWGKVLKSHQTYQHDPDKIKSYGDLFETLEILPDGLREKFKDILKNIN